MGPIFGFLLSIIGTEDRRPGYDSACKTHCSQVPHCTHVHRLLAYPVDAETSPHSSLGAQHTFPKHSAACCLLQTASQASKKTGTITSFSLSLQAINFVCVTSLSPFNCSCQVTFMEQMNKSGQHKEENREISLLATHTCLTAYRHHHSRAELKDLVTATCSQIFLLL